MEKYTTVDHLKNKIDQLQADNKALRELLKEIQDQLKDGYHTEAMIQKIETALNS